MDNNEVELYLVGDDKSEKTNQWLMVSDSYKEALRYMDENPEATQVKRFKLKDRRRKTR